MLKGEVGQLFVTKQMGKGYNQENKEESLFEGEVG